VGPNFVNGALSPASNTGTSISGLIINNQTPQFQGKTNPGALVTLFVQGLKSFTTPTPVGTTVADSNGNWSITSFSVPADSYLFTVQSVDPSNSMATAALTTVAKPLVIDLTGPVINSATLNAKAKQILIVFQDSAGLNIQTVANPSAYGIAGKGVGRITTLNVSGSGTLVSVAISFSTRKGFAKKATFLVRSSVVTDNAGNHLNGTFLNHFPTGNGGSGGNFLVNLPVKIKPVKKPGGVTVIVNA
jgi:Bacterial Ig-like domain